MAGARRRRFPILSIAGLNPAIFGRGSGRSRNPGNPIEKSRAPGDNPLPLDRGRSSGVEHNLAKVRVGRSIRLARSKFPK